ncbi:hypothetical protein SAMN02745751_00819 [Dethiosulfatibacter aminovorans DSM 17477]|uniref:Prepilin-type N-terminal cleavage/methylation domain-containing protein n=1 Tax=Dethiosulfatibacter aminovorans DSM 17477 TaxID=1121476 RepID=A0A1M6D8E9_9FIRM|nr:hypothetical protein [Dethiosulfatibacter aminovorans]SHI69502.1 hypothetical protein SAMN02745751_00819 [Dethiosulfatibacter aminovorans DSM 17477]
MTKIDNKGLTLVEMIIALGMTSFVMVLVFSILLGNIRNNNRIDNSNELQYQAQVISNFLNTEISQAYGFDYDDQEIILKDNDDDPGTTSPKIKFTLEANNTLYVEKTVIGTGKVPLAEDVVSFNLTSPDNNNIRYEVVLERGDSSYNLINVVYMRNMN